MYNNTRKIAYTAIGIALYFCISMTIKIPIIAHIGLDLGYIVLAVYCYNFCGFIGALVGGVGCCFVSLIASGWFPPGWILGNLFIGFVCGKYYKKENLIFNLIITIFSVFIGIAIIKTAVECAIFGIPILIKFPKNFIAFLIDSITMCFGVFFVSKIKEIEKQKL